MSNPANVNVICRFRPMNELERTSGNEQICSFTSPTSLTFNSSREKNVYRFNFDRIFPPSSTQKDIYDFGVKGIIDEFLLGNLSFSLTKLDKSPIDPNIAFLIGFIISGGKVNCKVKNHKK